MPILDTAAPVRLPPASVPTALHEDAPFRFTRAVLAVFLCGVFAFLDLYCTQPALPLLSRIFHASEAQASMTISAATLGVALTAAGLALFGERIERKRTIVRAMLALGLLTLVTASAGSLPLLAFFRLLQGLVMPCIFIITIAYVTEEWPAHQLPQVMSIYVSGTVFGGFVGRLAGGILADHLGWRAPFIFLGVFGLIGTALTARLLPVARFRPPSAAAQDRFFGVTSNLRNPRLLATLGIGFCMLFTLVSVFSYVAFYLAAKPFLLTTDQLSYLFAVYLVGLFATLAAGKVLVRFGLRRGMLAACALCIAGTVITLFPSLAVVSAGLALVGSGVFIAQTCANSFLRDVAEPGTRISAAGLYICSYYIGGTVGGLLPGLVWKVAGWPGCVALTCGVLVLAALLTFFGWRARHHELDPVPLN
jgi:predicted MFS family arabinose efflux permease